MQDYGVTEQTGKIILQMKNLLKCDDAISNVLSFRYPNTARVISNHIREAQAELMEIVQLDILQSINAQREGE